MAMESIRIEMCHEEDFCDSLGENRVAFFILLIFPFSVYLGAIFSR